MSRLARAVALVVGVGAATAACSDTPARVGDRFVDLYFVEIDQARARALTAGLAEKKIDDELHLVESVRRSYSADQAKPTVFYTRRDLRDGGDRARATYDVTVRFGGDETHKQVMLALERDGARWRVTNYLVSDGALPVRPPDRSPP